jgi:galactokinase
MSIEKITEAFQGHYGHAPAMIVRAPGRVNLIGEHTDYNDGFVLPMAINRAVWIALDPTGNNTVELFSLNYGEMRSFELDSLARDEMSWIEYFKGVAWSMLDKGLPLTGFRGVLWGDVPPGAGLSSSAAVEMALARSFDRLGSFNLSPVELALVGQKSENDWVGIRCGIMDQMISSAGQSGNALMLDCRSLNFQRVPLPGGVRIVIMDTTTRRDLESSIYNDLRSQCEAGADHLRKSHLRDVSAEELEASADDLDPLTYRRCRHVITENQRVLDAVEYLNKGEVAGFGKLMNQSHESLRDDFEVSSRELNIMQEVALEQPGCLGARMTGAGFGGCAVALVEADQAEDFSRGVTGGYLTETGLKPNIYITQATSGAAVVKDLDTECR